MDEAQGAFLELRKVTKKFGSFTAVDEVDLVLSLIHI